MNRSAGLTAASVPPADDDHVPPAVGYASFRLDTVGRQNAGGRRRRPRCVALRVVTHSASLRCPGALQVTPLISARRTLPGHGWTIGGASVGNMDLYSAVRRWVCIVASSPVSPATAMLMARPRIPIPSSASPAAGEGDRAVSRPGLVAALLTGAAPTVGSGPVAPRRWPPSGARRGCAAPGRRVPRLPLSRRAHRAAAPVTAAARSGPDEVRILSGEPASIDPAGHGDAASATVVAQLYESLTAFDACNVLRPALAESWTVEDGGLRMVFTLRGRGWPSRTGHRSRPTTSSSPGAAWYRPGRPVPARRRC